MTKMTRSQIKARRKNAQRNQQRAIVIGIIGIGILLIAIVAGVTIYQNTRPVGDIITITPIERPAADGKSMGDPTAPVQIWVFEDFQCPACKTYSDQVEARIITDMADLITSGKVYYEFRQYPFLDDNSSSSESDQAANASMCALEQGRFWDYHDMLYANWSSENAGAFADNRLIAFADALNLDMAKFKNCFAANTYKNEINADLQAGAKLGVTGTPSVFVNGTQISPSYIPRFEDIKAEVDRVLGGN